MTMNLHSRLQAMLKQAVGEGKFLRVWDARFCHAGIPELHKDHLLFLPGSLEVQQAGDISGPSKDNIATTFPKAIPFSAIAFVELTPKPLTIAKSK